MKIGSIPAVVHGKEGRKEETNLTITKHITTLLRISLIKKEYTRIFFFLLVID